ncbi:MAG: outer membrane beta-barrel protein [Bacteroidales bacterium]|nr:outer membrane beta-barrel protein [Bacteroidales bacterium]
MIKSMLEQAEAPVPEGSWEAIRARIPKRTAVPVRKVWWGVGAGLAAAAAVAFALVLGGTFRSEPASVTGQDRIAQVSEIPAAAEVPVPAREPVAEPAVPVSPAQQTTPGGIQSASTRNSGRRPAATDAASTSVQGLGQPAAGAAPAGMKEEETSAPVEGPSTASKEPTRPSQSATQPKQTWSDPFARMAYEDARRKAAPKASFQFHGLVGTNDKATSPLRSGIMAASAKVKSESGQSADIVETGESRYAIPISFGVGAKFYLSDRWALGTGVNFTLLSRSFSGTFTKEGSVISSNSDLKHTVQYIGIPVNLYYDLISSKFIKMYAFGGGSVEKGISQKYTVPGSGQSEVWKTSVPGVQGSAGLGLGIQMKLSDHMGLYLDPSAKYYFGADQPKTIRTQQNVMFNLELGVRFDL